MISKSKWYPILYSWRVHEKECSNNLYKLQFDYESKTYRYSLFVFLGSWIHLLRFYLAAVFFILDMLQRASIIFVPLALSVLALIVEFRNNIGEKKTKIEDYSSMLEKNGLSYIIKENKKFINQNYKQVVMAGNIILKKFYDAPMITLFLVGSAKDNEPNTKLTRIQILLKKLHLLPKSFTLKKTKEIPVFEVENVDVEYKKRIHELSTKSQNTQGTSKSNS